MSDLSDDELMILYSDGDSRAFDVLFDRHSPAVYNFACTMLNDGLAAEEILQDTFLAIARSAHRYEGRGQFRAWMMRIVRNRCLNRIESERLRRETFGQSALTVIDPPSPEPPVDQQIETNETMTIIRRNIATLPPRQREVIVLYAFEQMTYRQIADVLEIPVNTVKTLIHRARAALAAGLDGRIKEQ